MRLDTTVVTTESNIQVQGTEVGFDPEAFGHIMSILSNMYSDIELAVIREYSANAWDAHVAAGITDPIEVFLPTNLNPTYIVKDHGLGLSKDQILNVYGRYGKSTKRDSNAQIGGFGIGAKAAFALGHQFVVTGIKDGIKVVVLFALNARNVGEMKVVHEGPTEEPNGVQVSMAVEDVESFNNKARLFFGKWEIGSVLVDGSQPASVYDDAQVINEFVHVVPNHEGAVFLTLGQIAYPVSSNIISKAYNLLKERGDEAAYNLASRLTRWYNDSALFLHAEIGSAEIAPTREALMDSSITVGTVADLIATIPATLQVSVQETVDACLTAMEAAQAKFRLKAEMSPLEFDGKAIQWKGLRLPEATKVDGFWLLQDTKSYRSSKIITTHVTQVTINCNADLSRTLVIEAKESEQASVRRFATRFFTYSDYERILLVQPGETKYNVTQSWFSLDAFDRWTVEDYKAHLKTLPKAASTANTPSYSLNVTEYERDREDRVPLDEIVEEGKDIVIFRERAYGMTPLAWKALTEADLNVLVLGPTQTEAALIKHLAKMEADIEIVEDEVWRKVVQDYARTLYNATDDEKVALGARNWLESKSSKIYTWDRLEKTIGRVGEITNPLVLRVLDDIALARLVAADISEQRVAELAQAAQALASDAEAVTPYEAKIPSLDKKFPLIDQMLGYYWFDRNDDFCSQGLMLLNALGDQE